MLKRSAIMAHRWLGVGLCLLFSLWFLSGIGMMYWDFPSVTEADRLERSERLNHGDIHITPDQAYGALGASGAPTAVHLSMFDGRPVYRFRTGRSDRLVYADTGEVLRDVSRAALDRIAASWTGQDVNTANIEPVAAVDQWTVQGTLRTLRPLWKYSWSNGEQVYVAQSTGEVVQYTTSASRRGAYLGPIPHWLYFTPLRKRQLAWSRVVIWTSGIGTVTALLGMTIGVWTYSPSKRYRYDRAPSHLPYRGQKRWHAILGLVFGLGAATWAFSGMLSMDPFPGMGGDARGGEIGRTLRGRIEMSAFGSKRPGEALAQLGRADVRDLELGSFAGDPVYVATLAGGTTHIVPMAGEPRDEFDGSRIADAVMRATRSSGGAAIQRLDAYDRYYLDRHRRRPLPVILVRVNDPDHTRYYIDPKTARVVAVYSSRSWVTRWLYHGLHSLDFPWLYDHRPAWDIVVITFMLGGAALSITSIVLAWRVVARSTADAA
jgi:hypothetical protein